MQRTILATAARRKTPFPNRAAVRLIVLVLLAGSPAFAWAPAGAASSVSGAGITVAAAQQIEELLAEKAARSPAQRKISSQLLYAMKQSSGQPIAAGVRSLTTSVETRGGRLEVDITADVSPALLDRLRSRGVTVLDVVARYRSIRARLTFDQIEAVAAFAEVRFVQPAQNALGTGELSRTAADGGLRNAFVPAPIGIHGSARATAAAAAQGPVGPASGAVNSEGDATHRADLARATFGVNGSGVRICVLSDGVNSLAQKQAAGELPAVTVLPGQVGSGDEGTAMLEIVHDIAPSAQLFFAGIGGGANVARFAQDILDLRANYACDIMVDDISYLTESPFQKGQVPSVVSPTNGGIVTQAVNTVAAQGVLYFSSAGNSGNLNDGQSGAWEGNFVDGGAAPSNIGGRLHDFDPGAAVNIFNAVRADSTGASPAILFWSDPLGASDNDYDLFVVNPSGTIVAASTEPQDGTQDPVEGVAGAALTPGNRFVVVKFEGADRFLHLNTNRARLTFGTSGVSFGHNAAETTFSVAATPAKVASGPPPNPTGPFPNPFSAGNVVEQFSSDGPRLVFFNADSTPITPGNLLAGGGQLLQKPDATAADGVSTSLPPNSGFNPFFGTSAAAPHAAAIAALVKSKAPSLSAAQIRALMLSSAIDIEASGPDRDSGAGIVDAYGAVNAAIVAPPSPSPSPSPPPPPVVPLSRTFVPNVGR